MKVTIHQEVDSRVNLDEWQLPRRMRDLIARLNDELLEPTRNALKSITENRKDQIAQAESRLKQCEEQHRNELERAEKALSKAKSTFEATERGLFSQMENVKSETANIHKKLQVLLSEAEAHITKQGVELSSISIHAPTGPGAPHEPCVKNYLTRASGQLANATKQHAVILGLVKAKKIYWPDSAGIGWLGVTGAMFLAHIMGSVVHSSGVTFVFTGLFYASFLAILNYQRTSKLHDHYLSLRSAFSLAKEDLVEGLTCSKNGYRTAATAAEAIYEKEKEKCRTDQASASDRILNPAKRDYDDALKETEVRSAAAMITSKIQAARAATRFHKECEEFRAQTVFAGADWKAQIWNDWIPDLSPGLASRVGTLTAKTEDLKSQFPDIDWCFSLPALIPFSEGRCVLLKATGKAKVPAAEALQSAVIRALANTPPGKARFTLIDPVGLGHNVADFMHLGDFNPELINGKAWTEPQHIEEQLSKLTEDMETVIQTFLRKKFTSIQEYNEEHNEVAEPFRFLVVFDFPVNFTESSARRLISIVKNGPRCGVYALILQDSAKALPYGFNIKDLEDSAAQISVTGKSDGPDTVNVCCVWEDPAFRGLVLELDDLPPQKVSLAIINKSGEMSAAGMKKDVPFEKLLAATQKPDSWRVSTTSHNLTVALGPAGKGKPQALELGGGQEAHALLVGRTGSGKTNLMHVIITNLALTYSPQELQLYLIDFKGGVGFKRYAEYALPHAKVIAIESEREFGMSVLSGLDAELKNRSETFRAAGVDNLAAYRARAPQGTSMPRILMVVDEFQEFFAENDDTALQAKLIFDRLARQGRSFGIHFLLATQSLSGSAQLPASIMGQIKVRIALPCSEDDSRLILADDNKAARALSQAGEAIYNAMGGVVEGNNKFQVAHFNEEADLRKYLAKVSEMAQANGITASPLIFEGNELARVEDSKPFQDLIAAMDWPASTKSVDVFLGSPIAILPPVSARFRRQSGANMMILTRDESEGVGMSISALVSILLQRRPGSARVYVADFTTADSEWAEHAEEIARCFPGDITVIGKQKEIGAMLATVAEAVRLQGESLSGKESVILLLQGMHRIKALRENNDDENGQNAIELLETILRDGPETGVHVIAWSDTLANAMRGLSRKAMAEFGLRVGTAMSADESMNFFDDLAASKYYKPHRALFTDEDRPGQRITFRPYAMPPAKWLAQTGERLKQRMKTPNTVQ